MKKSKKNDPRKENFYRLVDAAFWMEWQSTDSCLLIESLEETIAFGQILVNKIPECKLVLLEGPLGAGKTSLVKGIAIGLDIYEPITSPTFPLAQHYYSGRIPLFHLDLYRLENHIEANDLFLQAEEEAREVKALMVVEWPERLNLSVTDALRIKMEFCSNGRLAHSYLPATSTKNEITSS